MSAPRPSAEVRAGLARKYRTLAAWRKRRDRLEEPATRHEMRALAAEFPGCLRELDTLGLAELERRAGVCEDGEAPAEAWVAWIAEYHTLMRAALRIRAGRKIDESHPAINAEFVAAVRSPPEGRLNQVVMRALAVHFRLPIRTVAAALFTVRRESPYRL